jgi:hypothetical protein
MGKRDNVKDRMTRKASVALLGKHWAPFDRLRVNGYAKTPLHSWCVLLFVVMGAGEIQNLQEETLGREHTLNLSIILTSLFLFL